MTEPNFPSGFPVEKFTLESLSNSNPELVEFIRSREKRILDLYDKNLESNNERLRLTEKTKRLGMGLVFGVIVSVLIYSGVTGDKALTEKVIIGAISFVAGAGGVLFNQQKDR